ncbi:hypothetical protein [Methylobacterium marchantiae]|uniref:Anti-sigma factor NepR domain-containing protein n=1 Tax=Methylobacterium marchantiae TaxID=600331 RepID=A0ABW3X3M8_9HYPH|nr:hypothetical protein AIGOOFII_3915 [Methylobacterium marchantiae]
MNTAANFNMANINRSGQSYTIFPQSRLMQSVGEDLRAFYGQVIDPAAPADLLRLAALIDERRGVDETAE